MPPDCPARRLESPARRRDARSDSFRLLAAIEKVNANHVQCGLARLPADGFAVTGEAHTALFDRAGMREGDVHRSDGFLLRPTARPRNSSNADAKCAADAAPNS